MKFKLGNSRKVYLIKYLDTSLKDLDKHFILTLDT